MSNMRLGVVVEIIMERLNNMSIKKQAILCFVVYLTVLLGLFAVIECVQNVDNVNCSTTDVRPDKKVSDAAFIGTYLYLLNKAKHPTW